MVVNGMSVHANNLRVQRQACQALRNMVARSPDLRDAGWIICVIFLLVVLGEGAETRIRAALEFHAGCNDVARGALRDLGCAVELRELWTGTAGLTQAQDMTPDVEPPSEYVSYHYEVY